jgi:thymidylate synthase (FAD)
MKSDLINYMGSDLTVVNAARVSFDKQSGWDFKLEGEGAVVTGKNVLKDSDAKLINYLAKNGHWTPFSHCMVTLRETIPIFVARQRFKHMVGFTYNEVSRRYVDDTPEFYRPEVWRSRPEGSVKQGSGITQVNFKDINFSLGDANETAETVIEWFYDDVVGLYNQLLEAGVAPEQARMVLPQSMFTSYYVTGSLYAFARAYNLRSDPHAQKEIQDLAATWDEIMKTLFPVSWEALCGDKNGTR